MHVDGKMRKAHQVAKFLETDEWIDGEQFECDHICHIKENCKLGKMCPHRRCVEVTHLKVVPKYTGGNRSAERSNAGWWGAALNSAKTECPKGHPYDEKNTYLYRGVRYCRTCMRIRDSTRQRRQ